MRAEGLGLVIHHLFGKYCDSQIWKNGIPRDSADSFMKTDKVTGAPLMILLHLKLLRW